jgi:hypothetical protein
MRAIACIVLVSTDETFQLLGALLVFRFDLASFGLYFSLLFIFKVLAVPLWGSFFSPLYLPSWRKCSHIHPLVMPLPLASYLCRVQTIKTIHGLLRSILRWVSKVMVSLESIIVPFLDVMILSNALFLSSSTDFLLLTSLLPLPRLSSVLCVYPLQPSTGIPDPHLLQYRPSPNASELSQS